jgi:DNA-binding LacI/PurR family transcriptional regulator
MLDVARRAGVSTATVSLADIGYSAGYSLVLCNSEEGPEKEASYLWRTNEAGKRCADAGSLAP